MARLTKADRLAKATPEQVAQFERLARMAEARAEADAALAANKCPKCGRAVRRNLSLSGWVQCSQFGAEQFRADASLPACEWQGFATH